MSFKRLIIICALPSVLVGCAEFYGSQPPAPIYGEQPEQAEQQPVPKQPQAGKKKSKSRKSKDVVTIQPLNDSGTGDIKTEALPSPERSLAEPVPLTAPVPLETAPGEQPRSADTAPMEYAPSPQAATTPIPTVPPSPPAAAEIQTRPAPEPALAPAPTLTPFEPLETTGPLSPAVGALVTASNQNTQSGDLDSAASAIERAIRIEPRNASLFYKLALLRLKQSKPRLAEDLAKKSALLASTDSTLKKHCWLLVAHARELQQDFAGAKQARDKADSF
ncbi:MAG: tetratricopeptide repeat protein [Methylobacter sp.]